MPVDKETAKEAITVGTSLALEIVDYSCPPLGFILTVTTGVVGGAEYLIGKATNNEEFQDVGEAFFNAALGGVGGAIGGFLATKIWK